VKPGADLCRAYQETKVVLNCVPNHNVHPRVFEGISSGGFVLSRQNPNDTLPHCFGSAFEIGQEALTFSSREELLGLVERAFTDEPWRQSIIAAGRARVLRDHTYVARARTILERIRRGVGPS
jgi:spore maturation protein CgeB